MLQSKVVPFPSCISLVEGDLMEINVCFIMKNVSCTYRMGQSIIKKKKNISDLLLKMLIACLSLISTFSGLTQACRKWHYNS